MTHSGHGGSGPAGYLFKPSRTVNFASSKLSLSSNPLQKPEQHGGHHHGGVSEEHDPGSVSSDDESSLKFRKRESASTIELFYDLWFVANLNVFATIHPITDTTNLESFVCYFLLLWITWFVTTVHDARFGQDGVLERMAVAGHLGVMMGFAVAGVSFEQSNLIGPIFRTTALCLMASRIILSLQYSLVLFHTREHPRGRKPLIFTIALHTFAATMYLVSYVMSSEKPGKHLSGIWYTVGMVELIALLLHATLSDTLSLKGTHFNERLNLLTLIILGEGIIILSKNLSTIVTYTWAKDASYRWSPELCGLITCAGAMMYIAFQLYFDWMDHHITVSSMKQAAWSIMHLPLHVCLVLMAEGSGQFVLWWHALESFQRSVDQLVVVQEGPIAAANSAEVARALNSTTQSIMYMYSSYVGKDLSDSFTAIAKLPAEFWSNQVEGSREQETYVKAFSTIIATVFNVINDAFKLSVEKASTATSDSPQEMVVLQANLLDRTTYRLQLVFIYAFICAGSALALLMAMRLVSKQRHWTCFNKVRAAAVFTFGLGLSLVALLATNDNAVGNYLVSPWPLPTITIVYALVLVLTHLPHPSRFLGKKSKADLEMTYMAVQEDAGSVDPKHSRGEMVEQSSLLEPGPHETVA